MFYTIIILIAFQMIFLLNLNAEDDYKEITKRSYTEVNSKIGNLTRRPLDLNQLKAGDEAAELE